MALSQSRKLYQIGAAGHAACDTVPRGAWPLSSKPCINAESGKKRPREAHPFDTSGGTSGFKA
jgi:hypothetical protein